MILRINGMPMEYENDLTLLEVIQQQTGQKQFDGMAVALNGEVIIRKKWETTSLQTKDSLEILQAVSGG
ncbi:MAG: sulfur carrier protein ThiS [Myxococcota bacterium]|nr:sulfur carrier protein ThiS [Myxococcota bacterium]